MPDGFNFRAGLDALLAEADARRATERVTANATQLATDLDGERFLILSDVVIDSLLAPRLELLASRFASCSVSHVDSRTGRQLQCTFAPTARVQTHATLTAGILLDRERRMASVYYSVEIRPLYAAFELGDHLDLLLEAPDLERTDAWLGERLLTFAEAYLALQRDARRPEDGTARDPVCGLVVCESDAARELRLGARTLWFCSEQCERAFMRAPARYPDTAPDRA